MGQIFRVGPLCAVVCQCWFVCARVLAVSVHVLLILPCLLQFCPPKSVVQCIVSHSAALHKLSQCRHMLRN